MANIPAGQFNHFVQIDLAAQGEFTTLILKHPKAAAVMSFLIRNMGRQNALVVSQSAIATRLGIDIRTVRKAVKVLADGNWIEVIRLGGHGMVCGYVVNSRVAWKGKRTALRHALFSANVFAEWSDQVDRTDPHERRPDLHNIEQIRLMLAAAAPAEAEQLDIEEYIAEHDS